MDTSKDAFKKVKKIIDSFSIKKELEKKKSHHEKYNIKGIFNEDWREATNKYRTFYREVMDELMSIEAQMREERRGSKSAVKTFLENKKNKGDK